VTSFAHHQKLRVNATEENKCKEKEIPSVLAKVTQVSDKAHGPLVCLYRDVNCRKEANCRLMLGDQGI
jgi:hypothetical protein